MATNLQGSSHRPRAVGGAYDNRKDFIYEILPEFFLLLTYLQEELHHHEGCRTQQLLYKFLGIGQMTGLLKVMHPPFFQEQLLLNYEE